VAYKTYEETHREWIWIKAEKVLKERAWRVDLWVLVILFLIAGCMATSILSSCTPAEAISPPVVPSTATSTRAPATATSTRAPSTKVLPISTKEPRVFRDPTFDEMMVFLNKSTVNWNEYVTSEKGEYTCLGFACDLRDEANKLGIRAALIIVIFPVESHALVAFQTTDKGLIYWEPQSDHRMKVEVGRKYWSWIYWPSYDYQIEYDDTVVSIKPIWDTRSIERRYLCP